MKQFYKSLTITFSILTFFAGMWSIAMVVTFSTVNLTEEKFFEHVMITLSSVVASIIFYMVSSITFNRYAELQNIDEAIEDLTNNTTKIKTLVDSM